MDLFLKTKYNAHHPPPQYLTPTYPARIPYQLPLLVNPFIVSFYYCLIFSGFVRGPPNAVPELVTFQQDFKKGALLTVVSFANSCTLE